MSKTRVLTGMIAAGAIGLGALLGAAPAQASPIGYLNYLGASGYPVYDTEAALRAGYTICIDLNTHNGVETAARIYNTYDDVLSMDQAYTMLFASVQELCPWHNHTDEVYAS